MNKKMLALIGISVLVIGMFSVNALSTGCLTMCYDPVKNSATKGYDPAFLKQTIVLETCQESHKDLQAVGMKDLGYCDKKLGTL